jgi:sugar phosphate isomerase/epimerase
MLKIPLGLQLYSIREGCARDMRGCLKAVAEMGYVGVEFAGYHGHSAQQLRGWLDEYGLLCCGTHTALSTLQGDELWRTIEFNQTLGNKYLIVPWLAERYRDSSAAWMETAVEFNRIADYLAPYGMLTGYHNHWVEFQPIAGGIPFDLFFANTKPEVVMQTDIGNAMIGGGDPIACLRNYPGRSITIHLKEYSASNPKALVGEGDVDWKEVFRICETTGKTEWYIVEYESDLYPPLENVRRCRENLRKFDV